MRRKLAAAALIAGAAALPAPPANAYCDPVLSAVVGGCTNGCGVTAGVYDRADAAAKDRLPDSNDLFLCPM